MFDILPIEIIEYILFYLSVADIISIFSVFKSECRHFSEYFWNTLCIREKYEKSYESQDWVECFFLGANVKLGYFTEITDCPVGTLKHVYRRSLVTCETCADNQFYYVHLLNADGNFNLVQTIEGGCVYFKGEFCLVKREREIHIYKYNEEINVYTAVNILPDNFYDVFGISSTYCTLYNSKQKCLKCYGLKNDEFIEAHISAEVKFVLSKIYHNDNIAITTVSDRAQYEISLYDLHVKSWILNLRCSGYSGLTNDPNIWLGSNFLACCDSTFRARRNYFGPFLVWDKKGNELFRTDMASSSKYYLRCFLVKDNIVLTTSEDTIKVFSHVGDCISAISLQSSLVDMHITAGFIVLLLCEENNYIEVFNLIPESVSLYRIQIESNDFSKLINGHFLYCVASRDNQKYKVIKYY